MANQKPKIGIPVLQAGIVATHDSPDDYVGTRWIAPTPDAAAPAPESSGFIRRIAGDGILTAVKGAIGVPEAAVGLADIVSGGNVGKTLANEDGAFGFRPQQAKAYLDQFYSPEQKAAFAAVQNAANPQDGMGQRILDTGAAALRNPSTILHAVGESLPSMAAGGVIGRGVMAAAPKAAGWAAAGIGEGVVSMGSTAEQIRQGSSDGLLTGKQSLIAAGSGALTTGFGMLAGKVAGKMGIGDIDTLLVGGKHVDPALQKGFVRQLLEGAFTEGIMEELPQAVQEQMAQNYALGKPLDEGVDQAVVMGVLSGGAMGMSAQVLRGRPPVPEVGPMSRAANLAGAGIAATVAPPVATTAPAAPVNPTAQIPAQNTDQALAQQAPLATETIAQPTPEVSQVTPVQPLNTEPVIPVAPEMPTSASDLPATTADAFAQRERDRPTPMTGEVLPGDILHNTTGKPFKSMPGAMTAQRKAGDTHEIVPVAGGLVVRLKETNGTTATDTGLDQTTHAGPSDQPAGSGTDSLDQPVSGIDGTGAVPAGPDGRSGPHNAVVDASGGTAPVAPTSHVQDQQAGAQTAPTQTRAETPQVMAGDAAAPKGLPAAASVAVEGAGVAKEPWQMTREEYARQGGDISYSTPQGNGSHRDAVEAAVARGEKISPEVLKGYPWIAADESIKPYADGLRSLSDKELSAEEKRASAALNKWSNDTPAIINNGEKPYINSQLHSVDSFEVSARFNAVNKEIDRRKDNTGNAPPSAPIGTTPVAPYSGDEPLIGEFDTKPEAMKAMNDYYLGTVQKNGDKWAAYGKNKKPDAAPLAKKEQAKADLDHLFGVDQKRTAAIDRIAAGKAWFGSSIKAGEFIHKNGLKATHEAIKTSATRWDVKAKDSQPTESTNVAQTPQAIQAETQQQTPERAPGQQITEDIESAKRRLRDAKASGRQDIVDLVEKQIRALRQEAMKQPLQESNPAPTGVAGEQKETDNPEWTRMPHAERLALATRTGMAKLVADKIARTGWADITPKTRERITAAMVAPAAEPVAPKPKSARAKIEQARQARADYFTPGNIVTSYGGGHDEVISYTPPKEDGGGWSVKVHAVKDIDGEWVRIGKPQDARTHSTQPDAQALKSGPVDKVSASPGANEANYTEPRADGKPFPNAPVLNTQTANANKPEIVVDKAEMRPYRKPDGSVGYEAVPIQNEAPATPISNVIKAAQDSGKLQIINVGDKPAAGPRVVINKLGADGLTDAERDSGKKPYSDAPAAAAAPAAKPDPLSDKEKAAKAKMFGALGKLAALASKNTRMNWTPEEEQQLLPIVIELFDGAMELGSVTFQKAVRYVREFIANGIDQETADAIPFETLQGAYIHTARKFKDQGATTGKEVMGFDSLDELEKSGELADTKTKDTTNAARQLDSAGQSPLEGTPADTVSGIVQDGATGASVDASGRADAEGTGNPDGPGLQVRGGVGSREGTVPVPSGGRRGKRGSTGQRGVQSDAGAQPGLGFIDTAGGTGGLIPVNPAPNAAPIPAPAFADFTIEDDFALGEGGPKSKFKGNIEAVKLLKQLDAEGRMATPTEQAVLARYVGWGGLAQAFDHDNADWSKEYAELKGLMSDDDYADARVSTRYAHYTSRQVIQDGIYAALKHMGFNGGRALEGGAGVGNFMGLMPIDMRSASRFTAIEREPFSAKIAKNLYPQQNVQEADFTEFFGNDDFYDVAVGNPPFASDPQVDRSGRKHLSGLSLHNYFFAKEVDMLREGGILAQVVTNSFLDASTDTARTYIAEKTKFLGAIRLPNNAFSKNAGTEVTTDLIFLQKRPESEWGGKTAKLDAKQWLGVGEITDAEGRKVPLNQYFIDHPDMMLGKFGGYGTMYRSGASALVQNPGQDTAALLKDAVAKLPGNVYTDRAITNTAAMQDALVKTLSAPSVQEGGYFEEDGKLFQRIKDIAGEAHGKEVTPLTQWTEKTKLGDAGFARIKALSAMRSTLRGLLAAELSNDAKMVDLRQTLNTQYDAYAKEHGLINDAGTLRVFDDDPDFPLLASLEHGYTPAIGVVAARSMGIKPVPSKATKGPIFTQRVVDARQQVAKVETPADALAVSMAERGKLDSAYIGELLGRDSDEILQELSEGDKPLLFKDPATGEYALRDAYLSGNVRSKLVQAKQAGMFNNIRALEEVQPEDVGSHEIVARVGSPWVPESVYQDFAKALFGEGTEASVKYVKATAGYSAYIVAGSTIANTNTWGIADYPGTAILTALLNNKPVKVTWTDKDGTHTDVAATENANAKAQDMRNKFQDWLFADGERAELLGRAYNDTNNNYVTREFDGEWMTFPGKVPNDIVKFRRHQRNAIARIVQDRTALLDHVVGSGKTYTIIAAAMELRRTGLAKKPMIAVPNHLVKQWAADFYKLYPGANILTATKKDFEKTNRRKFLAQIATGDWDAVIIAHSSFGFIKPAPEFEHQFNAKQIANIIKTMKEVEAGDGDKQQKKRTVKQLEGIKERLENRIKALRDKPMDALLDFGELGVDQLFVDEAHMFKNLMFSTKMQNIAGLGDAKGSQRAYDMYVKANQIFAQNGRGQGLVFATGTPVSNSLAEMYHMMRYLMPAQMEEMGFESFDAWANTYASVEQVWMQKASADGFKAQNRMSNFVNTPELLKVFDQVSDTVTMDDIKAAYREENDGKEFPLPKLKGGKRAPVSLRKSAGQEAYMATVAARALALEQRKGPPQKGEDNILVIMSDARKAAMDIRLVDPSVTVREPGGRIDRASQEIFSRYKQYDAVKGTQLVFSDLGTPLKTAKKELVEYQALMDRIEAGAGSELMQRAAMGDEAAQGKIDDAEDAQAELDAKGRDWLGAMQAAERGFSVYDDLKAALIEKGIPENEIAFIHDYNTDEQKAGLFRKMNAGQIRVLVGSTPKLGAGTNVQERLVALHHLDVPWKPSDVEQREGRIIRQGNKLDTQMPDFEVEVLAYVTQDTLDMRMWQVQETKLKMINQLRTRKIGREVENAFEDLELSAGEMQAAATGNMDLLREIQIKGDIKKLEQRKRSFDAQKSDLQNRKKSVAQRLSSLPAKIESSRPMAEASDQYKAELAAQAQAFRATIDGKEYTDAKEAGAVLLGMIDAHVYMQRQEDGKYGGKHLTAEAVAKEPTQDPKAADYNPWAKRPVPLAVNFNGEDFKSRDKLGEAFSNAQGDREPIAWKMDGATLNRRTLIESAIRNAVAAAIADETVEPIGSLGPFAVSVEGQTGRVDKIVDVVLSYKGQTLSNARGLGELNESTVSNAVPVIVRMAENLAVSARQQHEYEKRQLETAKKEQADLDSTETQGEWPEQGKLEEMRQKHKEVLRRLSGVGVKETLDGEALEGAMGPTDTVGNEFDVAFSRASDTIKSTGQPAARVQKMVDMITSRWVNAPKVIVVQNLDDPRVPDDIRKDGKALQAKVAAQAKSTDAAGSPDGFIDKRTGTVFLIADKLAGDADVVRVLMHESLGHFGLRGVFGTDLGTILDRMAVLNAAKVRHAATRLELDYENPSQRRMAAEEVLAYMAQTYPELGWVKNAVAAIRTWLREHIPGFGKMRMTDAEIIRNFIIPARQWVEEGGPKGGGKRDVSVTSDTKTAFSRASSYSDAVDAAIAAAVRGDDPGRGHVAIGHTSGALVAAGKQSPQWFDSAGLQLPRDLRTTKGLQAKSIATEASADKAATDGAPGDSAFSRNLGAALTSGLNNVRDVKLAAGYQVADLFQGEGRLHWWHKSVGTMYHLAQKSPPFQKVYDSIQNFLNDVSYYAAEAADLAPNILPKLDKIGDVFKSPLSAADTKALSAPVFEGTLTWGRDKSGKAVPVGQIEEELSLVTLDDRAHMLLQGKHIDPKVLKMWQGLEQDQYEAIINGKFEREFMKPGVVFSPAELKQHFSMTDAQVALYQEFRQATDKSLDNLAISEMLNYAGKDAEPIRDAVLASASVQEAGQTVRDYLVSLTEMDPARDAVLSAAAAKMLDIAAHATDMKARGYAPLSRFGTFTLEATLPTGERYFSLFETDRERNKMARMLIGEKATDLKTGTMSQEAYKLLNGVSPETAALFGEMLGLESQGSEAKDLAFQEFIKRGTANRSAMKRLLHRKGIAGFSDDAGRVLAGFIYSNGRKTASNLHAKQTASAVNDIPKEQGELKDAAVKLQEYVSNPQEEAQAFRSILFAQYLGGSIASAMVNATQPFAVTFPYLSQFGGVRKAAAQMAAAVRDATKDTTGDARLDAALKRAEEEGIVSPQEVHSLQAQAMGRAQLQSGDGTTAGNALAHANNGLSKLSLAWGKVFGLAEQFNRRTTFIAAYRTAVEQGIADPSTFAEKAVNETQFVYNKGNKPRWARGAVGSVLFTFKQYGISYLEMVTRLATAGEPGSAERKAGQKAAVLAIAILFLMSGADGLPFVGDIEDVIDGAMQRLGYNFSSKQQMKTFLALQLGKDGAEFFTSGISGLPGVPIDVSGRLGMGNMIPATGLFQKKTDHTRDLMELAGPAGDLVKRGFTATEQAIKGDVGAAITTAAPTAARNVVKAMDMAQTGMYRDDKGRKVIETTPGEVFAKAIGFQPRSVKNVQDASMEVQKSKSQYILASGEIRQKMAQAIFVNDADLKQGARDDLAAWNARNPDQRMTLNMPAILSKVREMRKSKEQRMADTAPKAIRSQVRAQLREELR